MTRLVVDFPQLQGAIDHMEQFGREVAETLDEIDSEDIANDMRLRLRRWLERHKH